MFILGHLGIGFEAARRLQPKRTLLFLPFALGALLPDIFDKALYYSLVWKTGLYGDALGLISCTRTFGHSFLFTLAMFITLSKTKLATPLKHSLLMGILSHQFIDMTHDLIVSPKDFSAWIAFFFPAGGFHFASGQIQNPIAHSQRVLLPVIYIPEILGGFFLLNTWRQRKLKSLRH